jgi:hypothetical protein
LIVIRLGRAKRRLGGGLLLAAIAATTLAEGVVACATGTETGGGFGEGGLVEEDAGRDVNVVPVPKDSAAGEDTGTTPDDSGAGCTQKVVINELMSNGPSGAEFVELYNPSTCAVPIGNWELKYQASSGNPGSAGAKFGSGESIPAKGFFVVGTSDFSGAKDATLTAGLGNTGAQLGLVNDTGKLIDAVGYGTGTAGTYTEGTPAGVPATGGSIGRSPNGGDTNNNKTDFKTYGTPSPGIANP